MMAENVPLEKDNDRPLVKIELEVPEGVELRVIINGVELLLDEAIA